MKSFKFLIEQHLGCNIPKPVGSYEIKPGKLILQEEDKETFMKLYKLTPSKGIGNGEVALYWLFYPYSKETHGGSAADLMLMGKSVEVKSYKSHDNKIKLGKFVTDRASREKLTQVFGIANLLGVDKLKYTKVKPEGYPIQGFVSEVAFSVFDIHSSYKKAIELRDEIGVLGKEYKKHGTLFNLVEHRLSKLFTETTNMKGKEEAEELTKMLVMDIILSKLSKKPGEVGGFVCNVSCKDPMDIMFFEIKTGDQLTDILKKKNVQDLAELFSVEGGEILLNYNKL